MMATSSRPSQDAQTGPGALPPGEATTPAARVALAATLLVTGLHAGFFITYEMSITPALALLDDAGYVTAFQAINETVLSPIFMALFAGAAPVTALALVLRRHDRTARALLSAALVGQIAVLAITIGGNVPLNDRLAEVVATPDAATAARAWFEGPWNARNLARTVATVGAFAATCGALVTNRRVARR